MPNFFVLEDELDWLNIHRTSIENALTIAKFEHRKKVGEHKIKHKVTPAANYDEGVQLTYARKFDAYLVDGRFPMHNGDVQKHLLGVEFVKYLKSQGVPTGKIFFISSQHSMLEKAIEEGLEHVFKKNNVENEETLSKVVRPYSDLSQTLRYALQAAKPDLFPPQ